MKNRPPAPFFERHPSARSLLRVFSASPEALGRVVDAVADGAATSCDVAAVTDYSLSFVGSTLREARSMGLLRSARGRPDGRLGRPQMTWDLA